MYYHFEIMRKYIFLCYNANGVPQGGFLDLVSLLPGLQAIQASYDKNNTKIEILTNFLSNNMPE